MQLPPKSHYKYSMNKCNVCKTLFRSAYVTNRPPTGTHSTTDRPQNNTCMTCLRIKLNVLPLQFTIRHWFNTAPSLLAQEKQQHKESRFRISSTHSPFSSNNNIKGAPCGIERAACWGCNETLTKHLKPILWKIQFINKIYVFIRNYYKLFVLLHLRPDQTHQSQEASQAEAAWWWRRRML